MTCVTTSTARTAVFAPRRRRAHHRRCARVFALAEARVDASPSAEDVAKAKTWPTWGCEASEFPWTYGSSETCYVIEGECVVTPDDGSAPVRLTPGTLATFPAGMSCTWNVTKAIKKHYSFH